MKFSRLMLPVLSFLLLFNCAVVFSEQTTVVNTPPPDIQSLRAKTTEFPDYAYMYIGKDKYEKFNRRMFNLNTGLNKYIARPVHILWASVMPQYGMDRILNLYNNIEYPKRLVSCLLQRDGKALKDETIRFLTNTTLGLGGMFDPADKIFKIKPTGENMEQALGKCKMKSGPYLVAPILNSCTPRSLCGRALEAALDPSVYIATPVSSLIKFGLMLNRTSYIQPLAKMIETTYADPYDIQKKFFGIENYIKNNNLNREDLLTTSAEIVEDTASELENAIMTASSDTDENIYSKELTGFASNLEEILSQADETEIYLSGYNPQSPVVDSMRTALFDNPSVNKSIWNELSVWNRSFAKRIKTASISVDPAREDYKYSYILQKDRNAPVVILYPSIGEGAKNHHSVVFAKLFYDEGYSVIMQGSHFHWEFVKSMPEGFCPGIPQNDAKYIKLVTSKILSDLQKRYGCEFREKVVFGTSFGAMSALFLAESESRDNTLGISKYIAVSPPIELTYALAQIDKNADEFDKNSDDVKHNTAVTAAKILKLYEMKNSSDFDLNELPFSEEEGKLITTFIMRQKLSDLVFAIENVKGGETDFYEMVNNLSYADYAQKYLFKGENITTENFKESASLFALSDYLANNDNYKIFHSADDYFINHNQIEKLKNISGRNLISLSNGSHLGFMYRKEFLNSLISYIKI